MADVRINALATTAATSASDDFLPIDGATNNTRKLSAYSPTFGGNLTVGGTTALTGNVAVNTNKFNVTAASGNTAIAGDLTVSGTGTHTFAGVVRGTQMYGLASAAGTSGYFTDATNSTLYVTHPSSGVMSFKNGSNATWLSESSTNVTLAGNLTVSGTGASSVGGTFATGAPTGGAGAWKLGIANAVSPTSPNRTITVDIGGTLYYIHAKTTND